MWKRWVYGLVLIALAFSCSGHSRAIEQVSCRIPRRVFTEIASTDAELTALAKSLDWPWRLWLRGPGITDRSIFAVAEMPWVRDLIIEDTAVTERGLEVLGRLTWLRHLTVDDEEVGDEVFLAISPLDRLASLTVRSQRFTGNQLSSLVDLTLLRLLSLTSPKLEPANVRFLCALRNLRWLYLGCEAIEDEHIKPLATLRDLRSLDLQDTRVRGDCLPAFSDLPRLGKVRVPASSRPSPEYLEGLESLSRLSDADLRDTSLDTDQVLRFCLDHPSLESVKTSEGVRRAELHARLPAVWFGSSYFNFACGVPADYAVGDVDIVVTPLMDAVLRRDQAAFTALVSAPGCEVDESAHCETISGFHQSPWGGYVTATPLFAAALLDEPLMVRRLLEAGADPEARATYGGLPLHAAAATGNPEIVRDLLAAGADPNLADDSGMTALMRAAWYRQDSAVELLLAAGADRTLRDESSRRTAHGIASEWGFIDLAKKLETP